MGKTENPVVVVRPSTQFISLVDGSITKITANDWNGCTSIRNDCFKGLTELSEVETPDTLLSIGQYAFSGCTGLTKVIISDSVTTINLAAFNGCSNIAFMLVGEGLTRIFNYGISASSSNSGQYVFLSTVPPTISAQSLSSSASARIYVPTPDTYRVATNWTASSNKIFPLVTTIADLANIVTTKYTKACVIGSDKSYKEYTYDGSQWNEV